VQENPIDAIPDLSENQVIVFTGGWVEAQVIEDQVTYPLVSNLQVFLKSKYPGFFHVWDEFYLHHFEDNVDPYWAEPEYWNV
jgi:Cu(I)/Ag(I) efflux system membrane protein CusA/SilA